MGMVTSDDEQVFFQGRPVAIGDWITVRVRVADADPGTTHALAGRNDYGDFWLKNEDVLALHGAEAPQPTPAPDHAAHKTECHVARDCFRAQLARFLGGEDPGAIVHLFQAVDDLHDLAVTGPGGPGPA